MVFAYFGPETTLPLTSALAAIFGFVLMFGQRVRFAAVAMFRKMRANKATKSSAVTRHSRDRIRRPDAQSANSQDAVSRIES